MRDTLVLETVALGDDDEIRAILADVCRITGMASAALARITETRWITCQVVDRAGTGVVPGSELELNTTISEEVRRSGRTVLIDDATEDRAWRLHRTPVLYGFKSHVVVPVILRDGSFFGTLCAADLRRLPVRTPEMMATLERHAARLGEILSAARLTVPAPQYYR